MIFHDDNTLNIYRYGSRVYGTASDNSDHDFIVVQYGNEGSKQEIKTEIFNMTVYDEVAFQKDIDDHEISALECLFLPRELIALENRRFSFELNIEKLRHSISSKSSNSWVKAKKKFVVEQDFNPYIAKKSLFHSLRILMFGTQLAEHGKIIDYSEANYFWEEIKDIETNDWEFYKEKYQPVYNSLRTKFKLLAPKKVG